MNLFLFITSLVFFIDTGSVGCLGLILIAGFIVLLFFWRKNVQKGVTDFYQKNLLSFEQNPPSLVLETLGNANWQCYVGELEISPAKYLPFHWWRGYTTSTVSTGSSVQTSFNYYLAISFAPNTVSEDFQQMVKQFANRKTSFKEKLKNFFILDTKTPKRVEKLANGSFLIEWRTLDRPDIYTEKLNWLHQHLAAPVIAAGNDLKPPVLETNTSIERIPYTEIRNSAPLEQRAMIEVLMRVLDSMNRDYHDTKAHPEMNIDDHAKDLNLNQEQTDFVKKSLSLTAYDAKGLINAGFNIPELTSGMTLAVDVAFPHRKMTYLIAEDIYLDFAEPKKIYVYQK